MKKLAISITVAAATFVSSSAAFADEAQPTTSSSSTTSTTQTQVQTPTSPPMTTTVTSTTQPTSTTTTTAASTDTYGTTTYPTIGTSYGAPEADRPSYAEKKRPSRPLLLTGAITFTAAYATTVVATAANGGPDNALYIPVAGPWMHLASRDGSEGRPVEMYSIVAAGASQAAGLAIMLVSLAIPENRAERKPTTVNVGKAKVTFGPGGAVGTF